MRKVKAIFLSVLIIMSLCTYDASAKSEQTFSDVPPTHWAYSYIEQAVKKGYADGVGGGKYDPDGSISNAQFAAMLVKAFMRDALPQNNSDQLAWSQWWGPYMQAALNRGLLNGMALGEAFDNGGAQNLSSIAEKPITRFDMAEALLNTMNYLHISEPTSAAITKARASIADYGSVPVAHRAAVEFVYVHGCLTGIDSKGTFAGNTGMTRAQAAVVLIRLDELNETGTISGSANSPTESSFSYKCAIDYIGLTVNDVTDVWGTDFQYLDGWIFGTSKQICYSDVRIPFLFGYNDYQWVGKANGDEKINIVECSPQAERFNATTKVAPNIPLQINSTQLAKLGYNVTDIGEWGEIEFGATTALSLEYTPEIVIQFFWYDSVDSNTVPASTIIIWNKSL